LDARRARVALHRRGLAANEGEQEQGGGDPGDQPENAVGKAEGRRQKAEVLAVYDCVSRLAEHFCLLLCAFMKFRFIWPSSTADAELASVMDRYLGRIKHFYPIEVVEVAPERGRQSESDAAIIRRRSESARLIAAIPPRGFTVVLDERGQPMDSLKFAKWLERLTIDQPHGVNFVMGGDAGLDDAVKQ